MAFGYYHEDHWHDDYWHGDYWPDLPEGIAVIVPDSRMFEVPAEDRVFEVPV